MLVLQIYVLLFNQTIFLHQFLVLLEQRVISLPLLSQQSFQLAVATLKLFILLLEILSQAVLVTYTALDSWPAAALAFDTALVDQVRLV
jgi:hypothetical protein